MGSLSAYMRERRGPSTGPLRRVDRSFGSASSRNESLAFGEDSKGSVIIEFMVALPFLLLLAFGVFDVGRILNQYLLLTHAVSAGARYAAGIQDLTPALFQDPACGGGTPPDSSHSEVQRRVMDLVSLQSIAIDSAVCIRSARTTTGPSPILTGTNANEFVTVQIRATYSSFLPFMDGLPIQVTATAPYLLAGSVASMSRTSP